MPITGKTNALTAKFDGIVAENNAVATVNGSITATNDAKSPTPLIWSIYEDQREGDELFSVTQYFWKNEKTSGAVSKPADSEI